MSITRINDFRALPGRETALREFLASIIGFVKSAPGCQGCELLADSEDKAHLVIVETWDSGAAHQASVSRIPSGKIDEVRGLIAEPPKGRYYEPA